LFDRLSLQLLAVRGVKTLPPYERYGKKPVSVILIFRSTDEDSLTVVGHFDDKAQCQEWADLDGSRILTPGLHKPVAYQVMTPVYAGRLFTGRYVTGGSPDSDGFFSAGHGVTSRPGETRDGVHTVVVTRVPTEDRTEPSGLKVMTVPIGIFASTQDASLWVNLLDSFYPRLNFGESAVLRPVLTPDQFVDKVEEFRLKGQVETVG
jgi:hypothetical protein